MQNSHCLHGLVDLLFLIVLLHLIHDCYRVDVTSNSISFLVSILYVYNNFTVYNIFSQNKVWFDFLVKKISGFGEKNSNLVFSLSLFNVKAGLNINFDGQVAISRLPAEHKNFPNNSSTGFVQTVSQIYSIFNFPFVLDSLTQTNQNHNLKKREWHILA